MPAIIDLKGDMTFDICVDVDGHTYLMPTRICRFCFAVILEQKRLAHDAWHAKNDR